MAEFQQPLSQKPTDDETSTSEEENECPAAESTIQATGATSPSVISHHSKCKVNENLLEEHGRLQRQLAKLKIDCESLQFALQSIMQCVGALAKDVNLLPVAKLLELSRHWREQAHPNIK